jgi:hypothetical protein
MSRHSFGNSLPGHAAAWGSLTPERLPGHSAWGNTPRVSIVFFR